MDTARRVSIFPENAIYAPGAQNRAVLNNPHGGSVTSWGALTSVSNGGWIAYFTLARYWTALVPAISVTVLACSLAVLLGRRGVVPDMRAIFVSVGWGLLLILAWLTDGRVGICMALAMSFVLQVTPSVWTAYRTEQPTGVSAETWLLILAELLCWGAYGLHEPDVRLVILGGTGVAASVVILCRVWRIRRNPRPLTQSRETLRGEGPKPPPLLDG